MVILKKYSIPFLIGVAIASVTHFAKAQVLFEGYSKIMSENKPIGYTIAKYEYNPKTKQFIATTFLKTNQAGGNLTESLKAVATEDLKPVSYEFTTMSGTKVKSIDAKFSNGKMIATIKGDKKETRKIDVPKGAFLSSFLIYVMLRGPEGLKSDTKYDFEAIAEEDAALYKGIAFVKTMEEVKGIKAFRIMNEFKNTRFISQVTPKGEILTTLAPDVNISTELVEKPNEATNSFQVPGPILKTLFGSIPEGATNEISMKPKEPMDKAKGVPGGVGIQVKPGSKEK